MGKHYLPQTDQTRKRMLEEIGLQSVEELFNCCIPPGVRFQGSLDLPPALSEMEARKHLEGLAGENQSTAELVSFLGGGVADHYIPSAVDHIISRSEFYTAYTPYQPEVSQGTLQNIFEFQSMICLLTGLDVANASMYDGGSALAESAWMAHGSTRQNKIMISRTVHPEYRQVVQTYADAIGLEIVEIPFKDGLTDYDLLEKSADKKTAAVIIQQPNFFGLIENTEKVGQITGNLTKTLFVAALDPISLGLLKPPGEYGCDIAVGEGQPLGNPLSFGGPHLGFFAARDKLLRKMPGRIIGITEDVEGQRGFVMTMQTREQHIRRHRATSNICSNQALNALAAAVYMSLMGREGITEVAEQCLQKTSYLQKGIKEISGFDLAFEGPVFKEFVVKTKKSWDSVEKKMMEQGILPGIDLKRFYNELENHFLVCVTEKRTKEEMDKFLNALEGI